MVIQVACTVPIAKNLFGGQPFEGINFSEWKGNANIPLLADFDDDSADSDPAYMHGKHGFSLFFCNFFASLYVSPNRYIPSNHGR